MNPNHDDNAEPSNLAAGIAYDQLLRCVHCGLCTSSCPTYLETGDENNGPRGRIQLIRLVADGQAELTGRMERHLELCLDCRACESACPSGVQYGRLIEPFRRAIEEHDTPRRETLGPFPPVGHAWACSLTPTACVSRCGRCGSCSGSGLMAAVERLGLLKLLPGRLGRLAAMLPPPVRGRVRGCRNSCRRWVASGPAWRFSSAAWPMRCSALCIGRPSASCSKTAATCSCRRAKAAAERSICTTATPPAARRLADANLLAFELDRYDAILVNHGGCGAMLKEYGLHWRDGLQPHRARFAGKVKDVHEFLDTLGVVPFDGRIEAVATYHDSCHLAHAQRVASAPRRLLAKIPGLELRELPEAGVCCGAAGTYNLTEPEMSDRLSRRKLENIVRTGANVVLTGQRRLSVADRQRSATSPAAAAR